MGNFPILLTILSFDLNCLKFIMSLVYFKTIIKDVFKIVFMLSLIQTNTCSLQRICIKDQDSQERKHRIIMTWLSQSNSALKLLHLPSVSFWWHSIKTLMSVVHTPLWASVSYHIAVCFSLLKFTTIPSTLKGLPVLKDNYQILSLNILFLLSDYHIQGSVKFPRMIIWFPNLPQDTIW